MDDQMNTLMNPPFAQNPPFNLDAKVLGLVIAIIAAIGVLFSLLALLGLFAGSAILAAAGFGGILFIAIIGVLIGGLAEVLGALGGWQMYQGRAEGKRLVIYGLVIGAAGEIVTAVGYLRITNIIFPLIVIFAVYYLVVISRFPGEVPKTT